MSDTTVRTINLTDMAMVSEEELLDRAREGDRTAFGTLYLRHRDAARRVAGMCASSAADADDAVAEGFARVFAALPRMAGRTIAFRPYLLTCVRNAATDRLRRERRVDLRDQMPETPSGLQADDVALLGLERNLVGEALQALPSRWRTVLWLTEVEGLSPAEVSRRIGIKPNAVAALAYRARKGLREAYLQAHLRAEASSECRTTVSRLGNYVRGDLSERDRLAVQAHLDECGKCRCRRDELTDVNATLRNALLPVPMLLAGMQKKWFSLSQAGGHWWARVPEIAQAAQVVDTPLMPKAIAGLTMAVLAISGAAAPRLEPRGASPDAARARAEVSQPAPRKLAVGEVGPLALAVEAVTGAASGPGAAPAGTSPAGTEPATPAEGGDVAGGTRARLFPGQDVPGEWSAPEGSTRHRLFNPPGDPEQDGLLGPSPLAGLVENTLDDLGLGGLLPLEVGVSLPLVGGLLPGGSGALDVTVSVNADEGVSLSTTPVTTSLGDLPGVEATAVPDRSGARSVLDEAATDLVDTVNEVLQPVTGLLGGLTATEPAE